LARQDQARRQWRRAFLLPKAGRRIVKVVARFLYGSEKSSKKAAGRKY
jgi:hypothetical protein